MPGKYGITENGFVLKRLDEIKESICSNLKNAWGIDPSINPQSALNVLITEFADQLAELWESAEDVYYSQYPSSADGTNLDNAMQLGGVMRLEQTKTKYSLACTGADGTEIPYATMVRSTTQPVKNFICSKRQYLSRDNFRKICFSVIPAIGETYSVEINGVMFSIVSTGSDHDTILQKIYDEINMPGLTKVFNNAEHIIELSFDNKSSNNIFVSTDNILVTSVTSNIVFESQEYGQVNVPFGTITDIITVIAGFNSVTNDITPILGRLKETDVEARHSYLKRIFLHSTNMLESIEAEIMENVDGVTSLIGYENDTNLVDAYGRPPHSVEIVIEGGDNTEIARCIFNKKATGIQSFGAQEVEIADDYGNSHLICFNRPTLLNTWLQVTMTRNSEPIQPNYAAIVKDSIMDAIDMSVGKEVYLQTLIAAIYNNITGIQYIEIKAAISDTLPATYDLSNITVGPREKIALTTDRIEVVLV